MKNALLILIAVILLPVTIFCMDIVVRVDNGTPKGNGYTNGRNLFEESVILQPDGPCKIKKLSVYFTGSLAATDTVRICGYPTAGNLYPTQYIWPFNQLTAPIAFNYDGNPGWKEIDLEALNLRSDGYDKFVITHIMRAGGPWFSYDSDSRQGISWILDPFTPNPSFYDIIGTLYSYAPGDFMARLTVEYVYPLDSTSALPPQPKLTNVTAAAGLSGDRYSSVADWNNDGLDDISFSNNLYQNNGDGTFKNLGPTVRIPNGGTTWADFDNDGYQDLYAINSGSFDFNNRMEINKNKIYKNNGNSTFSLLANTDAFLKPYPNPSNDFNLSNKFENDSIHNPYNTAAPLWFDYNQDGWPDLFIANRRMETSQGEIFCPDQLWKNNGNSTFTNTRKAAKIDLGEPFTSGISGLDGYYDCYGTSACDYNNDRKVDLFVANYRLIKDNLYKNNGDSTFTEVGAATGVQGLTTASPTYFGHGMGCQWGDFDNDGLTDLCVGNLAHTDSRGQYSNPSLIFKNQGASASYKFKEQHYAMGLKFHEGNAGVAWLDLDLDGYLDLWHGKYDGGFGIFYLNQGPPDYKLKDMTWHYGAVIDNSWVAVYLDYDRDGDLDIIVEGRLLRNDIPHKGNWVTFRLSGSPADKVCTDAFGTKVAAHCGSDTYYRELMGSSAGAFCTQNSSELHFGIGAHTIIDSVVVDYPNGETTVLKNIAPNAHYRIAYKQAPVMLGVATPSLLSPENNTFRLPQTQEIHWTTCYSATKYKIQISTSKDFTTTIIDTTVESNNIQVQDLGNNTPYFWRVQAANNELNSSWSSVYTFITGTPLPSAPILKIPANDSTLVSALTGFEWGASTYPCLNCASTNYELEVREWYPFDTVVPATIHIKNLVKTSFQVDTPLKANKKYQWRVRGYNDSVPGNWSQVFFFVTTPLPSASECLEPANDATNVALKASFKWKLSEFAILYQLQIATDQDFKNLHFDKSDISGNTYKLFNPKLKEGTEYYWRVRGINDGGRGEWPQAFKFRAEGEISVNDGFDDSDLNVYPNPANTTIRLNFYNYSSSIVSVNLIDVIGNKCLSMSSMPSPGYNDITMDISGLNSGVYYLSFSDGKNILIKKISIIK